MISVIKANHFFEEEKERTRHINIVLDGLKTPENIGSALRLAGNIGCQRVIITERLELNKTKIEKIARNSLKYVKVEFMSYEQIIKTFPNLVAIETCNTSTNIYQTSLPSNCTFIVGNERVGISEALLAHTQQQVYIPMQGMVKSLNVSHALGIGLFEWYRQNYENGEPCNKK